MYHTNTGNGDFWQEVYTEQEYMLVCDGIRSSLSGRLQTVQRKQTRRSLVITQVRSIEGSTRQLNIS